MLILRQKRKEFGYTQPQIAKKIGLGTRQYFRIEHGLAFPKQKALNKLEDIFGLPQRVLFSKTSDDISDICNKFKDDIS